MNKVLTVTFNPAIDKSITVPALLPEKKLSCSRPILEPGGGGVNVARVIERLGGNPMATFPAGGYNGQLLKKLLEAEHVNYIAVPVSNDSRENLVVLDQQTNLQYRFGMPGPVLTESEWRKLLEEVEQINNLDFIVASGSIPEGVPKDIFARLALIARNKKTKLIVDTSGEPLRLALQQGIFMIKPNLSELAFLAGRKNIPESEIETVAKQIIASGNCSSMVVSMGSGGAMMISSTETFTIKAPEVSKKSTIGAGDSMVAGIVYHLTQSADIYSALAFGIACGTATTMHPGTQLCNKEEVLELFSEVVGSHIT